jgi:DNA (cytosine-5)-methyltransferase 1
MGEPLTVGSLFSGIGGFDLAFRNAGARTAWLVEIEPRCQQVLARHFPDALILSDVREVGAHNLPRVDVISFGSPCQDLSVAGKRAGLDGARSGLFFEAARIIRELRPTFALWENVPGALSSADGRDFGAVLDELAESGAVDLAWRVLDAQWFGVAQRRRRVFLVADFGAERAAEILSVPEGGPWDSPPSREAGARAAASLTAGTAASSGVNRPGRRQEDDVNIVTATVTSKWAKGTGGPSGDECQNIIAFDTTQITSPYDYSNPKPGNPCHPLAATAHPPAIAYQCQGSNVGEMGTLRSGNGHVTGGVPFVTQPAIPILECGARTGTSTDDPRCGIGIGEDGDPMFTLQSSKVHGVASNLAVRRLTPLECTRLQGYPDDWLDGLGLADSAKYRMLGNSVAVPCVEWIARRIANA